jgi:hypothetical protein
MRIKILALIILTLTLSSIAFAAEIARDVKLDSEKGEVSYFLDKPVLVRISLGIEDGPMFATLIDWDPRQKGANKEKWNKTGISEIDKLLCNKKTIFTFNYFTTDPEDKPALDVRDIEGEQSVIGPVGRASGGMNLNYFHKNHNREFCHEPKINISLPADIAKTEDGIAIIDKPTVLTIEIDPKDRIWFNREKYSLYIFVDTVFAHGAFDGFSPYHWRFDPKGLNKGKHLIVVNLRGFSDHIGIVLLPVYVKG